MEWTIMSEMCFDDFDYDRVKCSVCGCEYDAIEDKTCPNCDLVFMSKTKDKPKTHIKVFVTKNVKFRARIKEPDQTYEVTVGGKSWNDGKGKKYIDRISKKCDQLIDSLKLQCRNI